MTDKEQQIIKKAQAKQREGVEKTCNRLTIQFQINRLKTWKDVYVITGYDDAYIQTNFASNGKLDTAITLKDLKEWCAKLRSDVEKLIAEQTKNLGGVVTGTKEEVKSPTESTQTTTATKPVAAPPIPSAQVQSTVVSDESGMTNTDDYGLPKSPNERAFLFWFQKRAAREMLEVVGVLK